MGIGTKRIWIAATTMALGLTLTPTLEGCNSTHEYSGNTSSGDTSQMDKPINTTEPTGQTTEEQISKGESNLNQLACVGDRFTSRLGDGYEIVRYEDGQRAYDCVRDAGQVKMITTRASGAIDYGFDAELNGKTVIFSVSSDHEDTVNFGILRARFLG